MINFSLNILKLTIAWVSQPFRVKLSTYSHARESIPKDTNEDSSKESCQAHNMYEKKQVDNDSPCPYNLHTYECYQIINKNFHINDITPNDERVVYKLYGDKHFIFYKNVSFETILDQHSESYDKILNAAIALQKLLMPSSDIYIGMVFLLSYYIHTYYDFDWEELVDYNDFMTSFFEYCIKHMCHAGLIYFDEESLKNNMFDALTFLQYKTLDNKVYGLKAKPKTEINEELGPKWSNINELNKWLHTKREMVFDRTLRQLNNVTLEWVRV